MPRRVPGAHRRRRVRDRHRRRAARGRVPHRPRTQPVSRRCADGSARRRASGRAGAVRSTRRCRSGPSSASSPSGSASRASPRTPCGTARTARCRPPTAPSVGVVGGGPAGLAAACDLRLAGHPVTVYEAQDRLGGMMVLGIPEYRLPRALIAREIEAIVELGIDVETGARVGDTVTLDELLDASRSAVPRGRHRPRPRPRPPGPRPRRRPARGRVPPERQPGLPRRARRARGRRRRRERRVRRGPHRARAADRRRPHAASAHRRRTLDVDHATPRRARRACVDVTVIALESPDEIPADPEEIDEAEREGIKIVYRRGPHRFVAAPDGTGRRPRDDRGRVGVRRAGPLRADVHARAPRRRCRPTPSSSRSASRPISPSRATRSNARARAACTSTTRRCGRSHPRIWAGGDVAHGPAQPDRRDRRRPTRRGLDPRRARRRAGRATGHEVRVELRPGFRRLDSDYDAIARRPIPSTPTERRVGFGEVEIGYDEHERAPRRAALPALLRQRHALARAVHPVRPVRRRVPARLHHDRARRRTSAPAPSSSRRCCSTRTSASAAASASTAARPAHSRWCTREELIA